MPALNRSQSGRNPRYPQNAPRRPRGPRRGLSIPPKPANYNRPPRPIITPRRPASYNRPPLPIITPRMPANDNIKPGLGQSRGAMKSMAGRAVAGMSNLKPDMFGLWFDIAYNLGQVAAHLVQPAGMNGRLMHGWNLRLNCGGNVVAYDGSSWTSSCLVGQVLGTSLVRQYLTEWKQTSSLPRHGQVRVWQWHNTNNSVKPLPLQWPQPRAWPEILPQPDINPNVWPLTKPNVWPQQAPKPIPWVLLPYRTPNPRLAPSERPAVGYSLPAPLSRREPWPDWEPDLVISPSGASSRSPSHIARPPKFGTKERKFKAGRWLRGAISAANAATEGLDALDAVYEALPAKYRRGKQRPDQKARLIWAHANELDVAQAIVNLILNHYTDKVIGGIHAGADRNPIHDGRIGSRNMFGNLGANIG